MTTVKRIFLAVLLIAFACTALVAADQKVPAGAKVYVAPMPDGFDTYLKAAIAKKKVPVNVVERKEEAEYQITGVSETQKAGKAKKIIMLDWHSDEQASISVSDLKNGEVVFAYNVNKKSSARGKQSTAEACAKHLKEAIKK
ncbi:MAG TPA: hypothetical protein VN622_07995 [Clostridia bacterium]|nr:hypothetical protein [Clostridia bacterium]